MLLIRTGVTYAWQKGALIGAAPSTCIRPEKDTCEVAEWSCSVRSNCHKIFNHHWTFFHEIPKFLLVGWTLWCLVYRTTSCFCFTVYWHRMDLTLVGSSPSTGGCTGATKKFYSSSVCAWPSLSSRHFPSGSPHRLLDSLLLSFRGSEGSSNVVLCPVWSSLSWTPSRLRSIHAYKWTCDFHFNSLDAA